MTAKQTAADDNVTPTETPLTADAAALAPDYAFKPDMKQSSMSCFPRRYLMAECGALQAALVEHANTWAAKFTDLLHRVSHKHLAALQERLAAARQALQEVWRRFQGFGDRL